jgi:hypothetical protein
MNASQNNLDLLDRILSKNLSWVSAADSKISPLLAIDTAMLGVLAALIPRANQWLATSAIFAAISAILLIASLICLICANFPRLKGPKGSLIYFGGISEYEPDVYAKTILSGITDDLLKDYAYQCHRNAEIAKSKFHFIKWATVLLYSALPVFLVAITILYNQQ